MSSDIQLSGMEVSLVNAMSRKTLLRQYLDMAESKQVWLYGRIAIDFIAIRF